MYSFYSVFCLIIHFRSHFLSFSYFKLCVRLSIATLKFANGDYKAMIKEPRMAGPFIKSFTVMGRV